MATHEQHGQEIYLQPLDISVNWHAVRADLDAGFADMAVPASPSPETQLQQLPATFDAERQQLLDRIAEEEPSPSYGGVFTPEIAAEPVLDEFVAIELDELMDLANSPYADDIKAAVAMERYEELLIDREVEKMEAEEARMAGLAEIAETDQWFRESNVTVRPPDGIHPPRTFEALMTVRRKASREAIALAFTYAEQDELHAGPQVRLLARGQIPSTLELKLLSGMLMRQIKATEQNAA